MDLLESHSALQIVALGGLGEIAAFRKRRRERIEVVRLLSLAQRAGDGRFFHGCLSVTPFCVGAGREKPGDRIVRAR